METTLTTTNGNSLSTEKLSLKQLFNRDDVKNKFQEMLGKRAPQFITSVLQIAASNDLLSKAEPVSIYNAAMLAATLDLPINQNLGFAYIIPYGTKAQFQMGYRGFIQLAQRSGQFLTINSTDVREGEIKDHNRLTGEIKFEWIQTADRIKKPVVGYVAYFKLLNGFEKLFYMTREELTQHGKRYSQTFKKDFGLWKDDFDAMANKTVVKLLLAKFAPLSVEMQKAVITDQAIIHDGDATDVEYVDNEQPPVDKEAERVTALLTDAKMDIENCQDVKQVNEVLEKYSSIDSPELKEVANKKKIAIGNAIKSRTR